jgi:hypothetical protein
MEMSEREIFYSFSKMMQRYAQILKTCLEKNFNFGDTALWYESINTSLYVELLLCENNHCDYHTCQMNVLLVRPCRYR